VFVIWIQAVLEALGKSIVNRKLPMAQWPNRTIAKWLNFSAS